MQMKAKIQLQNKLNLFLFEWQIIRFDFFDNFLQSPKNMK